MNPRIRELKEQAFNFVAKQNMCKKEYFWENIRHNPELQDSVDAKFAELIVRECARVVENKTSAPGYGVAESWCEPEDLLKHFGVAQ